MTLRQTVVKALCEEMGWDYQSIGYRMVITSAPSIKQIEQILDRLQVVK